MKILATITAILAISSSVSFAKEPKEKPAPEQAYKTADSNGDGKVSEEEFLVGKKDAEKAKEQFKALDKDSDGSLTLEEFSAAAGGKRKKKE